MLYKKPPIKYTEMAIYIDNHIYTDDCDDDKVFLYLYHLSLMLAYKNKLFRRPEYYEDFALTFAEDMFFRLKNPKQETVKENGTPKMYKLTSILNYMKSVLYGRKVAFEQQKYSQSFSINQKLEEDIKVTQFDVVNQINYYRQDFNRVELEVCLENICKTIKAFLEKIPYYKNKKEWENIYISCLLTILNGFVKTNIKNKNLNNDSTVILYNLDTTMKDYITVLYRQIKTMLGETLRLSSYDSYVDEKDLIFSTLEELDNNNDYLTSYE